jgi:cell division septation protein DedD
MNKIFELSISKGRVVLLLASLTVCGVLLYAAGILTGLMLPHHPSITEDMASHPSTTPVHTEETGTATNPSSNLKTGDMPSLGPATSQLVVHVSNFEDRVRAQSFADSLKRQGFPTLPLRALQDEDRLLYAVRLGPYSDWDSAARAAADVQRSYNLPTYVRPLMKKE